MNQDSQQQGQQKIGRHMMIVAWIIALGFLVMFFNGVLERQHNPNQSVQTNLANDGLREIKLKRNRQGHYVARGMINNQPVIFLLDTGATVVSIPERVAKRLGLQRGRESYATTANGTIKTYATRLDTIGIGGIQLRNVAAQINPHMDAEEILLGMSFLKSLELIQRGDTLTLRQ